MQPTVTLTLYIPTPSVGAVIGRRGANIANLQKIASQAAVTHQPVRVSVIGQRADELPFTYSDLDFSDPNWTPVVIRADPRAAFTAAAKLEETAVVDDVVLDIPISRNKHAAIVGKRGAVLASKYNTNTVLAWSLELLTHAHFRHVGRHSGPYYGSKQGFETRCSSAGRTVGKCKALSGPTLDRGAQSQA
jgi:hypothetical protein